MTRTTELLKELQRLEGKILEWEEGEPIDTQIDEMIWKINGELKGRLDALKDEEKFILRLIEIENKHDTDIHLPHLVDLELASIQEEIKLIESAGVGK